MIATSTYNKFYYLTCFIGICFSIFVSCTKNSISIIYNSKIYTVDSAFSVAEAMAICNEKIIDIGSTTYILNKYKNAEVKIDAKGKFIYPGFIDAHCHFTGYAYNKQFVHLENTNSWNDVLFELKKYDSLNKKSWIIGRGWDNTKWANKNFPTNKELNTIFPNTPVAIRRIDGHAILCNDTLLRLAKITNKTIVEGGQIVLENNKPTGILIDNAMDIVLNLFPKVEEINALNYFSEAQNDCFALGLTGVVDCGIDKEIFDQLKTAYYKKLLQIRTTVLLSDNKINYETFLNQKPYKDNYLHIAGYKIYADGSLGSRGACLLHDYSDKVLHKGTMLKNFDSIKLIAQKLINTSYQMCTHAIGDSANRNMLKIYSSVLKTKNDRRWRIEHAQVVNELDFKYFKQFNIVPSVQPTHATSDMRWAEDRLGKDRVKNAYAYQKLLLQNNWLPLGTDFPVEDLSPLKTFYAAVARKDVNGLPSSGFQKENALSRVDALKGITTWAAKSVFEEKEKGSLEKGKFADFVILDNDILQCKEEAILKTKIIATFIAGKKVY